MSVPQKPVLSNLKDGVPLNVKKTVAAKWQSMSYWLIPLLTHLSFRQTLPLKGPSNKIFYTRFFLWNQLLTWPRLDIWLLFTIKFKCADIFVVFKRLPPSWLLTVSIQSELAVSWSIDSMEPPFCLLYMFHTGSADVPQLVSAPVRPYLSIICVLGSCSWGKGALCSYYLWWGWSQPFSWPMAD